MPLEEGDTFFFAPRPLRNLVLVDELDSLSPILACQVADLGNTEFLDEMSKPGSCFWYMMTHIWSVFMSSSVNILAVLMPPKLVCSVPVVQVWRI
jgi:hypothetical protein